MMEPHEVLAAWQTAEPPADLVEIDPACTCRYEVDPDCPVCSNATE
jgi:hypothetical protein